MHDWENDMWKDLQYWILNENQNAHRLCHVRRRSERQFRDAWPFPFQLYRTILVADDGTQKVEYLEIGVYRTTPLMPDRGLVGDNRSSKVFEFATFCSPTQSRRFFCLSSPTPTSNKIREGYFPPFAWFSFFLFLFRISTLSLFLSFSLLYASPRASARSIHLCYILRARKYKIYDCRYCKICGRCGARPKAGRFQVEIAFWRLIDSWLLESERYYYGARSGTPVASSEAA